MTASPNSRTPSNYFLIRYQSRNDWGGRPVLTTFRDGAPPSFPRVIVRLGAIFYFAPDTFCARPADGVPVFEVAWVGIVADGIPRKSEPIRLWASVATMCGLILNRVVSDKRVVRFSLNVLLRSLSHGSGGNRFFF